MISWLTSLAETRPRTLDLGLLAGIVAILALANAVLRLAFGAMPWPLELVMTATLVAAFLTEPSRWLSGREDRDVFLGRLFGYLGLGALVYAAGRLLRLPLDRGALSSAEVAAMIMGVVCAASLATLFGRGMMLRAWTWLRSRMG